MHVGILAGLIGLLSSPLVGNIASGVGTIAGTVVQVEGAQQPAQCGCTTAPAKNSWKRGKSKLSRPRR